MVNLNRIASFVLLFSLLLPALPSAAANDMKIIYVSESGDDAADGTLSAPIATIEEAKSRAISSDGDVRIEIMGGKYYVDNTLTIMESDTAGKNITFSAYSGENVEISNAKKLPKEGFNLLSDESILSKMPAEAEGKVYTFNLDEYGIKNYGSVQRVEMHIPDDPSSATVVEGDCMAEPAAWPNHGAFTKIAEKLSMPEGEWGYKFKLSDEESERVKRWMSAPDFYAYGFFYFDWADDTLRITSIDKDTQAMQTFGTSVFGMGEGWDIRFINLLEEMDMPGEFYIDRTNNILYYYPVYGLDDISLLCTDEPIMKLSGADNITFSGITFSGSRGEGIILENEANNNSFIGCEFKNIGGKVMRIENSRENLISGCHIHDVGKGGIKITAGGSYKKELISCNNRIENSLIENYNVVGKRQCPGICLFGIGDTASGNTIRHATQAAIQFAGNNNVIEKNDIYNVLMDSHDAGAVYSGHSWLNEGTVIRDNYIHDCKDGVAIYLDDIMTGATLERNRIVNMTYGVSLHGARYVTAKNNLFINIKNAALPSGMYWAWNADKYKYINAEVDKIYKNGTFVENIEKIDGLNTGDPNHASLALSVYNMESNGYNMEKWYTAFPYLKTMLSDGEAYSPKGNILMNNLLYSSESTYNGVERKILYEGIAVPPSGISKEYAESTNLERKTNNPPVKDLSSGDVTFTDESDMINTFDKSIGYLIPLSDIGCLSNGLTPGKVNLLSPENGCGEVSAADVVFAWEDVADADIYKLEIASDKGFSNVLKIYETNMPYYRVSDDSDFSLNDGKKYFWRVTSKVKSQNYGGRSTVSDINEFTTLAVRIKDMKVYDSNGKKLEKFLKDGMSIAEFTLENCSEIAKKIKITAQPYTKGNAPTGKSSQSEIYMKSFEKISAGFGIIVPSDAECVKISLDDGVSTNLPELIVDYYSMNDFGVSDIRFYNAYGRKLTDLLTQSANVAELDIINRKADKKVRVKAQAFAKGGAYVGSYAQNELVIGKNEKATIGLGLTATPDTEYIKIFIEDVSGNTLSEYVADYKSLKPETNDKLSFRAVNLKDNSGSVIKKLVHGEKNNLNLCIRNITADELPLKISVAVYDKNNRLEKVFVKESILACEGTENAFFTLDIPSDENSYVKTFLWNGENNSPLANIIEFR